MKPATLLIVLTWCAGAVSGLAQQTALEEQAAKLASLEAKRKAEPELARAVRTDPADAQSLILLGVVRDALGSPEREVASLFERARAVLEAKAEEQPETLAAAIELQTQWAERNRIAAYDAQAARVRAAELRRGLVAKLSPLRGTAGEPEKVGGFIAPPRLIQKREPEYSHLARLAKAQGTVVLSVVVEPDGKPAAFRLERSLGLGLDERAVEAVRQWRFAPGTSRGEPVPVQATIEVNFRLL